MCWYYIPYLVSVIIDNHSLIELAAISGYELVLPDPDVYTNYSMLMRSVALHSDCSDRYFNLFVKYCSMTTLEDVFSDSNEDQENPHLYYVLCNAVISNDVRIFNYALSGMNVYSIHNDDILVANLFFYFRMNMIESYTTLIENLYDNNDIKLSLVSAYCGGHYEEASAYLGVTIDKEGLFSYIFDEYVDVPIPKMRKLDLLTDIVDSVGPYYYEVLLYAFCMDYTLEEFERLWSKLNVKLIRRSTKVIHHLIRNNRVDVIEYLLSLDSCPLENIDVDRLDESVHTRNKSYSRTLAKVKLLLPSSS